ncbi:unnamed protein product [Zymoseptoria tritici ST99CH_1A5]|uniref:Uncharacterized protein n=1 Tax=Zymoseptoria tritici ST99CH_1A5 TaxID=1276529 RepID=A0A1Y6LMI5_ZYMTR|nr:unnamed protein product [Zymoseptoria tritici ST99CH_1A5]
MYPQDSRTVTWFLFALLCSAQQESVGTSSSSGGGLSSRTPSAVTSSTGTTSSSGTDITIPPASFNVTEYVRYPLVSFVLSSTGSATPGSASTNCRPNPNSEVTITLYERLQNNNTCYSLSSIFHPPEDDIFTIDSLATNTTCSPRSVEQLGNCSVDYMASGLERYRPDVNYTRVNWLPASGPAFGLNYLQVQMFEGEGCTEGVGAEPWFSWVGCQTLYPPSGCDDLPFESGVGSFRVLQKSPIPRDEACLYAAELGVGAKLRSISFWTLGLLMSGVVYQLVL